MSANGKSLITKEERGFIKIVAEEESGVIVGAQMMCARATDMIGEFVTAVANNMTVSQLLKGMRAHPTYNEGIGEALEELEGGAIHVMPRKRIKEIKRNKRGTDMGSIFDILGPVMVGPSSSHTAGAARNRLYGQAALW